MRWTIFLALLAALSLASPAHAADPTTKILRDCTDDGILQGSYTLAQLRKARDHIPAELNEYSDCGDVLSRAIDAKAAPPPSSGGGGPSGGTGGPGSTSGGGTGTGGSSGSPAPSSGPKIDPNAVVTPKTPADYAALGFAATQAGKDVNLDGRSLSPTSSRFRAEIGRNRLPVTLIVVLALLAAFALATAAPIAGRHVLARRQA
jgi:hypothetical protein